jgi:hypothetical protein
MKNYFSIKITSLPCVKPVMIKLPEGRLPKGEVMDNYSVVKITTMSMLLPICPCQLRYKREYITPPHCFGIYAPILQKSEGINAET